MFRAKTVLVVGAGASAEVGLPTGFQLLNKIRDYSDIQFDFHVQIKGDRGVYEGIKRHPAASDSLNKHLEGLSQIRNSALQAISIDNVIDAFDDEVIERVGKICIARGILSSEAASKFFQRDASKNDALAISRFTNTWYSQFVKIMSEGVKKAGVENIFDNISIINFNYDRCIEHFLPYSIRDYYGMNLHDAKSLVDKLIVFRPYGAVGRLPWQSGDLPVVEFGSGRVEELIAASDQIRTFTERVEEGDDLAAMKHALSEADRIIFLGFAFHRQNLELLTVAIQGHAQIVATAHGISEDDISVLYHEITNCFGMDDVHFNQSRLKIRDMECASLFKNLWRTITSERSSS